MLTLHIEHAIRDFETWRTAFDRDPAGRPEGGVRRYRVLRPVDDPNYVMIDLDFDSRIKAETFLDAMGKVWESPAAAPALSGAPRALIVETVDSVEV